MPMMYAFVHDTVTFYNFLPDATHSNLLRSLGRGAERKVSSGRVRVGVKRVETRFSSTV